MDTLFIFAIWIFSVAAILLVAGGIWEFIEYFLKYRSEIKDKWRGE